MVSELISSGLFAASVIIYTRKAGRHRLWFVIITLLLMSFLLLNATLFASNYFTGNGITEAVIYTLTNNLTGAGTGRYLLPAAALLLAIVLIFLVLTRILRNKNHQHHFGWSIFACLLAGLSINTSPAYQQIKTLIASHSFQEGSDFDDY